MLRTTGRRLTIALTVAGALLTASAPTSHAQQTMSNAQLEAFQQLSEEEQRALLEGLGSTPRSLPPSAAEPEVDTLPLPAVEPEQEIAKELRLAARGTLVIEARLPVDELPDEIVEEFDEDIYRARLLGARTFELDDDGILNLPGIASVPLAGLTAEEAAKRLLAEPQLQQLEITVTILPLTPFGDDALEPFGYKLFAERPEMFGRRPARATPVPRDYVLGPGDTLRIQLYGEDNYEVELEVSPEGTINFPKIGPQSVAGMTFGEIKERIEQRTAEQIIGTQAAVSMGRLKNIRVFVVGDVKRPGAYDVSSLSRITNALYASGGITEVGSLRRVKLMRAGKAVATLDLYELLLSGDTRNDRQLQADDVILIPPIGPAVAVAGEIYRPAIYEMGRDRSLEAIIDRAGGLRPTADRRRLQLERINDAGVRVVDTIDLTTGGGSTVLRAGDTLRVFPVLDEIDDAVLVAGHVTRPGRYEWSPGMRIADLLPTEQFLKPKADRGYVLIRRESGPDRRTVVLSADLDKAQAMPGSPADVMLEPRDQISVFELGVARSATIAAILDDLNAQASQAEPFQVVSVGGQVAAPGEYPLEQDMRVSDLLRAGGGLQPSAYVATAELTRFRIGAAGARETELIQVDLTAALSGDPFANVSLMPYDILIIKQIPDWDDPIEIELVGEFRFPGVFPVRRGETLSSVIERAGGLTELAFVEGSIFTREFLREREIEQLASLRTRLRSDLSALALQRAQTPDGNSADAYSIGQSLLREMETVEAQGRLVINLARVLAKPGDPLVDVLLRDGDRLVVPPFSQEVTVLGEVQYSTSHLYQSGLSRKDYIDMSGGLTVRADKKRIYIVRANGAVMTGSGSAWFRQGQTVQPGDTVVVPLDTDRLPTITQWASITQILFNLAIAAAAVNSF
ncbi:MAG: SLBB domain-containing protein [Gammaproteobacteria bacterium]|nr:SLBB domain-containing protein [Gammaproteobacteria bacterium]